MERRDRELDRVRAAAAKAEHDAEAAIQATTATKDGFVYLIATYDWSLFKIGWTRGSPKHRLRNIQTSNGTELELIAAVEGTKDDEAKVHRFFDMDRVREGTGGEWYISSPRLRMLAWCFGVGYPPKKSAARLEKQIRRDLAWLLGRRTYDDVLRDTFYMFMGDR